MAPPFPSYVPGPGQTCWGTAARGRLRTPSPWAIAWRSRCPGWGRWSNCPSRTWRSTRYGELRQTTEQVDILSTFFFFNSNGSSCQLPGGQTPAPAGGGGPGPHLPGPDRPGRRVPGRPQDSLLPFLLRQFRLLEVEVGVSGGLPGGDRGGRVEPPPQAAPTSGKLTVSCTLSFIGKKKNGGGTVGA